MAAASSPTASHPPSRFSIAGRPSRFSTSDTETKRINFQIGQDSAVRALQAAPIPRVTAVARKPVPSEKKTASTYTVLGIRQNDECKVLHYDKKHGFATLEGSKKRDFISTNVLRTRIFMAPLVIAKVHKLKNTANQPPEAMCMMSVNPDTVPTDYMEIDFVKILLIPNDGQELSLATLLAALNTVGGNHSIGPIDMDENQLDGMMFHGVYNTSGGTITWHAVHEFESPTLARETMQQKDMLEFKLAHLVRSGILSDPLREAIMNMIAKNTIGSVQIKLYRASVTVAQSTTLIAFP